VLVLDELDKLSYKSRIRRGSSSRCPPGVRETARECASGRVDVPEGTTLQFLLDPPGHERRADSSNELLGSRRVPGGCGRGLGTGRYRRRWDAVAQTLNPPPPSFETCRAGENVTIC
jgi:hypothetical protein